MLKIKKMLDCTIADAVHAWNVGFEGYPVNMNTVPDKFLERMVNEDLSISLSIIAFDDKQPIGIVLHGGREINGQKVAWNGGTGIAREYRGRGVGKKLMDSSISILKENSVDIATLEVMDDNFKAYSLYKNKGYKTVDNLEYLKLNGVLEQNPIVKTYKNYNVEKVSPQQIGQVRFYKAMNPWQTQWQSAKNGEGILVKDSSGNEIGYAYYQRGFDFKGTHLSTTLFQCEARPDLTNAEEVIYFMLSLIFGDFKDNINRIVPNIPTRNSESIFRVLKEIGFKTIAQQVYMKIEL